MCTCWGHWLRLHFLFCHSNLFWIFILVALVFLWLWTNAEKLPLLTQIKFAATVKLLIPSNNFEQTILSWSYTYTVLINLFGCPSGPKVQMLLWFFSCPNISLKLTKLNFQNIQTNCWVYQISAFKHEGKTGMTFLFKKFELRSLGMTFVIYHT